jgi:hypothetical protein
VRYKLINRQECKCWPAFACADVLYPLSEPVVHVPTNIHYLQDEHGEQAALERRDARNREKVMGSVGVIKTKKGKKGSIEG